jgi:hypothetical protein
MYSMGHVVRHSQAPAIQPAVSDTHGLEDFRTPSSDIKLSRFAVIEEKFRSENSENQTAVPKYSSKLTQLRSFYKFYDVACWYFLGATELVDSLLSYFRLYSCGTFLVFFFSFE